MTITEKFKKFLSPKEDIQEEPLPQGAQELNPDDFTGITTTKSATFSYFDDEETEINKQSQVINRSRAVAQTPEVKQALYHIVGGILNNSTSSQDTLKVVHSDESTLSKSAIKAIDLAFKHVYNVLDLDSNLYKMIEKFYIEGQLNVFVRYDEEIGQGITSGAILNPEGFVRTVKKSLLTKNSKQEFTYTYPSKSNDLGYDEGYIKQTHFEEEEIIRVTSGIRTGSNSNTGTIVGTELECAIRPANILKGLEDSLVPLRINRSVSRRLFNVDVSRLSKGRTKEVLQNIKTNFEQSDNFDSATGEISSKALKSLSQDYWLPSRDGQGTTIDILDEAGGALGETGDIELFKRKLYTSLNVPIARMDPDAGATFSTNSDEITRDELLFENFLTRQRKTFAKLFDGILKRQLISTGVLTEQEYIKHRRDFKVVFSNNTGFKKRETLNAMLLSASVYSTLKDDAPGVYSQEELLKVVFDLSDAEILEVANKIKEEETDEAYARFKPAEDEF